MAKKDSVENNKSWEGGPIENVLEHPGYSPTTALPMY